MRPVKTLSSKIKHWQESVHLPRRLVIEAEAIASDDDQALDPDLMVKEKAIAALLIDTFNSCPGPIVEGDVIVRFATSRIFSLRYGLLLAGCDLRENGQADRAVVINNILKKDVDPEIRYIADLIAGQTVAVEATDRLTVLGPGVVTS